MSNKCVFLCARVLRFLSVPFHLPTGCKLETTSYATIAAALGDDVAAADVVFVTDKYDEAVAAEEAGGWFAVCWCERSRNIVCFHGRTCIFIGCALVCISNLCVHTLQHLSPFVSRHASCDYAQTGQCAGTNWPWLPRSKTVPTTVSALAILFRRMVQWLGRLCS